MRDYTLIEEVTLLKLFVECADNRGDDAVRRLNALDEVQNHLTLLQLAVSAEKSNLERRIAEAKEVAAMPGILETKPGWKENPKEILEQLPMVETSEPKLEHSSTRARPQPIVSTDEPEHVRPPRDDQGRITRISTQVGDPGYDSEVHENKELKIFCNNTHIPTAHTADTVKNLVWYYEKNAKGRIKTRVKPGKVEIRGL